jgi:peptidoglycan/xylan/chitin deacetylase (PgdA/CDA1 family)
MLGGNRTWDHAPVPALARPAFALAYHGVADVPRRRDVSNLFVRPREVERHVATLRRWGYELLPFSAWADRVRLGSGSSAATLTFDDGFVDNLETLVPLLRKEDVPATVFVVSDWLGQPHPDAPFTRIVTESELRDLHAAGVEIGSHTRSHLDLTAVSEEVARRELVEGRAALEELLEATIDTAAYPYGRANSRVMRACGAAGFRAACRTNGEGALDQPLNLPRQRMTSGGTRFGFWLKRDDRYESLLRVPPARYARAALRARRTARRG